MNQAHPGDPPWLHTHVHEPNPTPPEGDGSFTFHAGSDKQRITLDALCALPPSEVDSCFIVSTGHGRSGPFRFGGVRLIDLIAAYAAESPWQHVDIESADGFGGWRLQRPLLSADSLNRPPLLALTIDGSPMQRTQGLVRLVVPTEVEDALLQVKWIDHIRLG